MMDTLPVTEGQPSRDVIRHLLETMELICQVDERTVMEIQKAQLRVAYYPVRGLEAVCAAMGEVALPTDMLASNYRNLGDVIAKGMDLRSIVAEFYGKATGTSKGKGGAMHLADASVGVMATSGIVGGSIPIAAGLALAAKLSGEGGVCFTTFGDGAVSIGSFHEAVNLAAILKLPLVMICQNNQWAEHTPYRDYAPVDTVAERAAAYGIVGERIDGNDVLACLAAIAAATKRARDGEGPTLLEFMTYRMTPHSAAGDASYVPAEELSRARELEALPTYRSWLLSSQLMNQDEIDAIRMNTMSLVNDAFDFAINSPFPSADELMTDVYGGAATGARR